jgi:hypothetical protein
MKAHVSPGSLFNQLRRAAAMTLAAGLLLAGCATPQSQPASNLPSVLSDVRKHPEKRLAGEAACLWSLANNASDFEFAPFISGFLDTPEADSGSALCAAIIEAVVAGDLTAADLDAFQSRKEARREAAVGTLLRKLIEAHERLQEQQGQQVRRPLPAAPGSPG